MTDLTNLWIEAGRPRSRSPRFWLRTHPKENAQDPGGGPEAAILASDAAARRYSAFLVRAPNSVRHPRSRPDCPDSISGFFRMSFEQVQATVSAEAAKAGTTEAALADEWSGKLQGIVWFDPEAADAIPTHEASEESGNEFP